MEKLEILDDMLRKIKSYDIISYSANSKVLVDFQHYTYDPNWDASKFDAK